MPEEPLPPDDPPAGRRAPTSALDDNRWRIANGLVGLTTVLGIVAVFTVGIRAQALDTDEWVNASTNLLDEPRVQEAVATHLVEVVYRELDVQAGFADLLPDDLRGLGPPLAGVLRAPLTDSVVRLLDSDTFQRSWETANRSAHEHLVKILRDDFDGPVSTADGQVTLMLRPLVVEVARTLGLPERTVDALPADGGSIVIFESAELDNAQRVVRVLDVLAWFVPVALVASYLGAMLLATGRRLSLLRRIGWSLLAMGTIVLLARALTVRAVVDAVVEDPLSRPSASAAFDIGTALLRQLGSSIVIYGAVIVLFTTLLGEGHRATSVRRSLARVLNTAPVSVLGGAGVTLMLLVLWRPGRAFEGWVTGVTLVLLVVAAVVALRTRTVEEFPDVGNAARR